MFLCMFLMFFMKVKKHVFMFFICKVMFLTSMFKTMAWLMLHSLNALYVKFSRLDVVPMDQLNRQSTEMQLQPPRLRFCHQEQQRVDVGPGNVHFVSVRQMSSGAATLRRGRFGQAVQWPSRPRFYAASAAAADIGNLMTRNLLLLINYDLT